MNQQFFDTALGTAMKAGQTDQVNVLRLIKTSLKNEQIKLGHELTEPEIMKVLQKEAKQRKDSITAYREAKRDDLVDIEAGELKLIEAYLPAAMVESELKILVAAAITEVGATSPADMGKVMAAVMPKLAGRADGASVSAAARELLQS
jgi:uncharacterized protein YqeY